MRNNSLFISAACDLLPGEDNMATKSIKYEYLGSDSNGNRLFGFSSGAVKLASEVDPTNN